MTKRVPVPSTPHSKTAKQVADVLAGKGSSPLLAEYSFALALARSRAVRSKKRNSLM